MRQPAGSTLFPYTTLFRSIGEQAGRLATQEHHEDAVHDRADIHEAGNVIGVVVRGGIVRSEEHTSELQSRENLVCRLLLEKKKTHANPTRIDSPRTSSFLL